MANEIESFKLTEFDFQVGGGGGGGGGGVIVQQQFLILWCSICEYILEKIK